MIGVGSKKSFLKREERKYMARLNDVVLIGKKVDGEMEPKIVSKRFTDGETANVVLNFLMKTYDEEAQRFITLPIAVWGEGLVEQCLLHLKQNDLICVKGELRYKFIYNRDTKQTERIFTTVKANNVEFLSKKMKTQNLHYYVNKVRLVGNLVDEPIQTEDGFVLAVDRTYPTKEASAPNSELTDFVTLILDEKSVLRGSLTKGSPVIIDGKLMTRKKRMDIIEPRIVVSVQEMVGV